jgi:leader peptidase (prepilin peptidase) / N-methyltransferase
VARLALMSHGGIGGVLLAASLSALLAATTITDLSQRLIPNVYLGIGSFICLVIVLATDAGSMGERGAAALGAAGILLAPAAIDADAIGMGDVKLAAVMGLYLGGPVIVALLAGFAAGGLAGIALLARHGSRARKHPIPFAPFLGLGGLVGLLVGEPALDWYGDQFL